MKDYYGYAFQPVNKQIERCLFIQDCFGRGRYGVRFVTSHKIFRIEDIDVKTEKEFYDAAKEKRLQKGVS